jgi:hypothetical protein
MLLCCTALLQIFDHHLPWRLELLPLPLQAGILNSSTPGAAAAPTDANTAAAGALTACGSSSNDSSSNNVRCIKLVIGLTESLLQGAGSWKRSPAPALLFKLLKPIDTDEGEACSTEVQQARAWGVGCFEGVFPRYLQSRMQSTLID